MWDISVNKFIAMFCYKIFDWLDLGKHPGWWRHALSCVIKICQGEERISKSGKELLTNFCNLNSNPMNYNRVKVFLYNQDPKFVIRMLTVQYSTNWRRFSFVTLPGWNSPWPGGDVCRTCAIPLNRIHRTSTFIFFFHTVECILVLGAKVLALHLLYQFHSWSTLQKTLWAKTLSEIIIPLTMHRQCK